VAATRHYHPKGTVIDIGVLIDSGWGKDSFITCKQVSDSVSDEVGVDGEVAVSVSNDNRWDVELTLMQTSVHNATLEKLWNIRKRSNGSLGMFPFALEQRNTGETLASPDAYIMAAPELGYGKTAGERTWKIRLTQGELKYI
jgi:hypothetical protein